MRKNKKPSESTLTYGNFLSDFKNRLSRLLRQIKKEFRLLRTDL